MNLQPGLVGEVRRVVSVAMTADSYGNPGVRVLATPALIELIEEAGVVAVAPALGPDERSVGTHLDVKHLAATPAGMEIVARATLVRIDGRRHHYTVEAYDARDKIGEGTMERFVLDLDRFMKKVAQKAEPD